jgi:signal peptidase I
MTAAGAGRGDFRPRRPWLAFLLGFFFPGLGQLYAGAPARAVAALAVLLLVLHPLALWVRVPLSFSATTVMCGMAIGLGLPLLVPLDAARTARRRRLEAPGPWNRAWVYCAYAVASLLVVGTVARWEAEHFWFRLFKIPAGGMENTLLVGDWVLADMRSVDPASIRRGEIVIFEHPRLPGVLYIKRVAGLPGESVELVDQRLYVDGEPVDEPHVKVGPSAYRGDFGPVSVRPGHVFVLGDHRARSSDSRDIGDLPVDLFRGRALRIYWSHGAQPDGRADPFHVRWERLGMSLRSE